MRTFKRVLVPIGVLAGGAMGIYFLVYAIGAHSEPFEYAEAAIRTSPEIHSMLGEVKDVSLKPLKGFRLKTRTDGRGSAYMSLHISASKRDAIIAVGFRRTEGTWAIVQATIDDQPVNLH